MPNNEPVTVGPVEIQQLGSCACFNLRKAARTVTQLYDDALRPTGLRATQLPILGVLFAQSPMTVHELSEATAIDRTTLTRSLKPLERDGLIRSRSGGDRRVRELLLTSKGKRGLESAYPLWLAAQNQVRRRLGAVSMDELVGSACRVVEELRSS
jgi:DNA-binding MarR family transcriptional regulator